MKIYFGFTVAGNISLLITGNAYPNCVLAPYSDAGEVESYLLSAIETGLGCLEAPAR